MLTTKLIDVTLVNTLPGTFSTTLIRLVELESLWEQKYDAELVQSDPAAVVRSVVAVTTIVPPRTYKYSGGTVTTMMSPGWRRFEGVTVTVNCWSWLSWEVAAPPF